MKKIYLIAVLALCFTLSGCATVWTDQPESGEEPNGVRIYPPKTYFFVSSKDNVTNIVTLPDYANAYDVNPLTLIAKQEFSLELNDGMLSKYSTKQDTTSLIELIKAAADVAKETTAPAGKLATQSLAGTFGLSDGIYVLTEKGAFLKIK
jgi:hypothetical protein